MEKKAFLQHRFECEAHFPIKNIHVHDDPQLLLTFPLVLPFAVC